MNKKRYDIILKLKSPADHLGRKELVNVITTSLRFWGCRPCFSTQLQEAYNESNIKLTKMQVQVFSLQSYQLFDR